MKKINDKKVYFYFAIVMLGVSFILGVISYYSILFVESKAKAHLEANDNIDSNLKKAYIILREPQVFAQYDNFDSRGIVVKNTIKEYDKLIYEKKEFEQFKKSDYQRYLRPLLERRQKGARLGRNTAVFFLFLSLIGWVVFLIEKKKAESSSN